MSTAGALAGVIMVAASAFACIPIAVLRLTPTEIAPGGTVNALIREVRGAAVPPVTFHWGTVDGPVLATVQPGDAATTATFSVPADMPGGDYVIWASQPLKVYPKGQFPTWGLPAKASLRVITPSTPAQVYAGASAVQTEIRNPSLLVASRSGMSTAAMVFIGLATVIIGVGLVAVGVRMASKRTAPAAADR